MNQLAGILYKLKRLKEAEIFCRKTLYFAKANLLPNHPDIAVSMINLAKVLYDLNRHEEAEELFLEALNFAKVHL